MPRTARLAFFIATLLAPALGAINQDAKKSVWDGVYTNEQADSGRQTYRESCASCHRDNLTGASTGSAAPMLAGATFLRRWRDRTVADLLAKIELTMPANNPDTLSAEAARDIVSFILKGNGMPAGAAALPLEGLEDIVFTEKPKD